MDGIEYTAMERSVGCHDPTNHPNRFQQCHCKRLLRTIILTTSTTTRYCAVLFNSIRIMGNGCIDPDLDILAADADSKGGCGGGWFHQAHHGTYNGGIGTPFASHLSRFQGKGCLVQGTDNAIFTTILLQNRTHLSFRPGQISAIRSRKSLGGNLGIVTRNRRRR